MHECERMIAVLNISNSLLEALSRDEAAKPAVLFYLDHKMHDQVQAFSCLSHLIWIRNAKYRTFMFLLRINQDVHRPSLLHAAAGRKFEKSVTVWVSRYPFHAALYSYIRIWVWGVQASSFFFYIRIYLHASFCHSNPSLFQQRPWSQILCGCVIDQTAISTVFTHAWI